MPLSDEEYKKKAEAQYDPQYNERITLLNNALNQQTDTLNSQKGGINEQYDTQETSQNRNNLLTKNNYSDLQTDRGLGRSTVATTGLSSLDDKNTRILGEINKARGRDLENIDSQISTLKNNTSNSIAQLGVDRQNSLSALINQFRQEDVAKEERDRAFQFQQQQFEWQKQQAAQQLAASIASARSKGSGGSSGGSSSSSEKATNLANYWNQFQHEFNDGTAGQWLQKYSDEIIGAISPAEYYKMLDRVKANDDEQRKAYANRFQKVSSGGNGQGAIGRDLIDG